MGREVEVIRYMPQVTAVQHLGGHRLRLTFDNGVSGDVDLAGRLHGQVFEALRDPAYFGRVAVEDGTLAWPNGADWAPEALYQLVLATGRRRHDLRNGALLVERTELVERTVQRVLNDLAEMEGVLAANADLAEQDERGEDQAVCSGLIETLERARAAAAQLQDRYLQALGAPPERSEREGAH